MKLKKLLEIATGLLRDDEIFADEIRNIYGEKGMDILIEAEKRVIKMTRELYDPDRDQETLCEEVGKRVIEIKNELVER